jgi:fluoroacetyl-CoA thioesterase
LPFSFDPDTAAALVGVQGRASLIVESGDTAIAAGSGDVPVLATPRMIALMEQAACEALMGHISSEFTSVGSDVRIRHRRPSVVGSSIDACATVTEVSGALVTFSVRATNVEALDPQQALIGEGTHTRVVVSRESFMRHVV